MEVCSCLLGIMEIQNHLSGRKALISQRPRSVRRDGRGGIEKLDSCVKAEAAGQGAGLWGYKLELTQTGRR